MNTPITAAAWFTPEQADASGATADTPTPTEDRDEQDICDQGTADQYGDEGQIAGAVTADDILQWHGG